MNTKANEVLKKITTCMGPTQPPVQWVLKALYLGVKWPVHEADHTPPSSAEVKNALSYTSTCHMSLWHCA